ncbi:hypothetical protein AGMMS49944_15040 [Spirochaetia bacterium]|nr:hypothetical protein AGMMS49944_15040 [Spirochaetia bacterium]
MKNIIIFQFFVLLGINTFANDSRTIYGSSVGIIDNENTNIIMETEVINITLFKEYYEIDVTFDFYNEGNDETVLLGFPIETVLLTYDNVNNEWKNLNFTNYINGNLIDNYTIKEEIVEVDRSYETKRIWYLREILFKGHEHTYSRVTYRVQYSEHGFFKAAGYIYGTGYNWKNSIGTMTINIKHSDDILIRSPALGRSLETGRFLLNLNLFKNNFTWIGNGEYRFVLNNIEPKLSDTITIGVEPFDIYGEYGNEFGDWAEGWCWNKILLYENDNEIRLYTKNQIRLFINFFYAFHGYNFKNQLYKNYFENFDRFMDVDSTKYIINEQFSEKDFNDIERKNLQYLLRIENMIP